MDDFNQNSRRKELAIVFGIILGVVAGLAGAIFTVFDRLPGASASSGLFLLGLAATGASYMVSFDVDTLRVLLRKKTGGTRYDQLRRWTRLKAASLFLSLMVLIGFIVLVIATLKRAGLVDIDPQAAVLDRVMAMLFAATAGVVAYAHYQSLGVQLDRDRNATKRAYNWLGIAIGIVLAVFGFLIPQVAGGIGPFEQTDGVFVHLLGLAVLGATLFVTRGLPTPYAVFSQDTGPYKGRSYFSRSKNVLMPTLMAFGMLFVLFLLFLFFGVELLGDITVVLRSGVVLAVIGLLAVAMMVSFGASVFLARQEDKVVLYTKKRDQQDITEMWILGISMALAVALGILAYVHAQVKPFFDLGPLRWLDMFTAAVLVAIGPIGFYRAKQATKIRRLEDRFPDFLRDLASSHKGGLTLTSAVQVASKGDYGTLTPEINKMADQLSWNVPFEEALARFAERVKTPGVRRTVSLILEASKSGGSTIDVLVAASRDAREIKNLETQRRTTMGLYTTVIYITFGVFLVVVTILNVQFVPEIIAAAEKALEQGASNVGGLSFNTPSADQFFTFYYMAAMVQAVGDGVVAGMMGSGQFSLGLRHSFIMTVIAYLTFMVLMV